MQPFFIKLLLALSVEALLSWLGPLSPESRQKLRVGLQVPVVDTRALKSSLFHQKLELMHIDFLYVWGLVRRAQQLINPPRLLPPMPRPFSSSIRPAKSQDLSLGRSYFYMKSRQAFPLPPCFSVGSQEQVYQLIRSLVFQMPTMMVSLILPSPTSRLTVFCTIQATPKAALLLSNRFWPS